MLFLLIKTNGSSRFGTKIIIHVKSIVTINLLHKVHSEILTAEENIIFLSLTTLQSCNKKMV